MTLVVNTHSRNGEDMFESAQQLLKDRGIDLLHAYRIDDSEKFENIIGQAIAHGPSVLIAGGGDGTLSAIAGKLANTQTILGVLPLGTTNNFARSIEIPFDLAEAIDVILAGNVRSIDLGRINDRYFTNVASIGISTEVALTVSHGLKRYLGRIAYMLSALKAYASHRSFKATIVANGKTRTVKTHQLILANGRFHGGTLIAHDAQITNGKLAVFYWGNASKMDFLKNLASFLVGRSRSVGESEFLNTQEATITTSPVRKVEIDGEVSMKTPITVSIAPASLKVLTPGNTLSDKRQ